MNERQEIKVGSKVVGELLHDDEGNPYVRFIGPVHVSVDQDGRICVCPV